MRRLRSTASSTSARTIDTSSMTRRSSFFISVRLRRARLDLVGIDEARRQAEEGVDGLAAELQRRDAGRRQEGLPPAAVAPKRVQEGGLPVPAPPSTMTMGAPSRTFASGPAKASSGTAGRIGRLGLAFIGAMEHRRGGGANSVRLDQHQPDDDQHGGDDALAAQRLVQHDHGDRRAEQHAGFAHRGDEADRALVIAQTAIQ